MKVTGAGSFALLSNPGAKADGRLRTALSSVSA